MSVQEHGFKAEVQQLLDLMIHSLYSHNEVFLRELISNAADALDKVRFLGLTESDLVMHGHDEPGIYVTLDKEARTIVIEDDGIGMNEADVIENLGTIAKSGSAQFIKQLSEASAEEKPELIGQFGVGFYSAFIVAERVTVETRSAKPGEAAVLWESTGKGSYTIAESDRTERGTKITLFLKEGDDEYLDEMRLRWVIRKHSNYVPWPVMLGDEKANQGKALWSENPAQVDEEEAAALYRHVSGDWQEPLHRLHYVVDSPLQISAMLFFPKERPQDLMRPDAPRGPRLYARRVLINEHAEGVLPDWLRFVRGVVDSADIQLNVSREMVQKTPLVAKLRKTLTKRVLKELTSLAEAPEDEVVEEGQLTGRAKYKQIWEHFGPVLKEGFFHDADARKRLLPLLRFQTIDTPAGEFISLADYRAAMPEGQDTVWYIAAESREIAMSSPHLEAFRSKGWNVLLMVDTVDEWFVRELTDYDELPVKSVARGEIDLDDDAEDDGAAKADLTGVVPWLTELFSSEVAGVRSSSRLTESPAVLVDDEAGISANMERILRASAEPDAWQASRWLELNPKHAIVRNLARLQADGNDADAEPIARLLLDDALLLEGIVKDPAAIGRRLRDMLQRSAEAALGSDAAAVS